MKNYNNSVVERLEQAHGAKIEKLFWIATSIESQELASFLEDDMSDEGWKECFPELFESEYFEEYKEDSELITLLTEHEKIGFIAEVLIPKAYNFKYKGTEIIGWSINGGSCILQYAYGDSPEELITAIEIIADRVFEDYKRIDLVEKSKPANF